MSRREEVAGVEGAEFECLVWSRTRWIWRLVVDSGCPALISQSRPFWWFLIKLKIYLN